MKKIFFIPLMIAVLSPQAFAQNPPRDADAEAVRAMYTRYSNVIKKRGFTCFQGGENLRAFRFSGDYDEIQVSIAREKKNRATEFRTTLTKNGRIEERVFSFNNTNPNYPVTAVNTVVAWLLSRTIMEGESRGESENREWKSPYYGWFAAGYHRAHDTVKIYPEKREGGYYFGMSATYDPSRLTEQPYMPLRFGDYMTMDIWAVADTAPERRNYVNEHFFNFDIMFYGSHRFTRSGQSTRRVVYGFYTGMEFFRPGWKDNVLLWSHDLYRDQPHIQYMIWRAVGWGLTAQWNNSTGSYSASFMAGLGPSINSSLFAISWDAQDEQNRSPLFQSLTGSKQNYYYSTAYPVSAMLAAERLWRLRLSMGYNFCFFLSSDPAIKGEWAWDILQIFKPSAGVYLLDNLMLNFNYERWYVHSMLNGDHLSHTWNRLLMELRYVVR